MVREADEKDLDEILKLYLYLHEKSIPADTEHLRNTWKNIINDLNHHLIVCEVDGKIVASCVCVVIPNLTRNVRPYAFVENVVTHVEHRKKGYATACLNFANDNTFNSSTSHKSLHLLSAYIISDVYRHEYLHAYTSAIWTQSYLRSGAFAGE